MPKFFEFAARHWTLFLALGAVLVLLLGNEVQRWLRGLKKVGPLEAVQLINHRNALILDVRSDGEFKDGHIPHARHMPLEGLKTTATQLAKFKDRPVVVYCRTGSRSARAGSLLRAQGFEDIFNLDGGILAWQTANLPVHRDQKDLKGKQTG
ncbi:MAG: hypothetical protein B7Z66_02780 [Chromatiales bacterium 21-64-14]|nr:MAG: hypothetical protein B7Z66_02780 [Chromatiales bacterium 21-64-14]HQU14547.1 rhodanese-like domain-containing protein [Gammaproteobacteria bacterium]